MSRGKLSPELRAEVIVKRSQGWTAKRCAEWLRAEHGIELTIGAVTKLTRTELRERSNDAKSTVRTSLKKSLPADLDFLQKILGDYRKLYAKQMKAALADADGLSTEPVHRTVTIIHKLVDLSLHYSGADQPDDVNVSDLAALLAKIRGT